MHGEFIGRFDSRHTEREQILCRKLARFCADNGERLAGCEPALPPGAFNRLADNWRPLFAIAEIAGGEWPARAAVAFAKLTAQEDAESQGTGTILLADIRQILADTQAARIFSKELAKSLCAMTDRPWPEANRGKPISENWLARRLHPFRISPKTLRIGDERAKGYEVADFTGVFERYLPAPGLSNRDTVTTPINTAPLSHFQSVTDDNLVTDSRIQEKATNIELSRCHASNPSDGGKPRELIEELI
jgi:putative DNA primase/helicase